ncbi:MAG: hypothetical protein GY906_24700 [bacterium]|nr:hypothetical protein [bacterium]
MKPNPNSVDYTPHIRAGWWIWVGILVVTVFYGLLPGCAPNVGPCYVNNCGVVCCNNDGQVCPTCWEDTP